MPRLTKVLIATPLYPPEIGGPATYASVLEKELPKRGIEVEVLAFREVRSLPKIVRHGAYFLRCIAKGRDCDIIFAQDPVSVGLPALLASKFMRKRFIVKIVGDYAWEMYQSQNTKHITFNTRRNKDLVTIKDFQTRKYDFLTEFRRKVERFVARKAEQVIVPSEYLKKIILMWGVAADRIKVIYNSFPPPAMKESRDGIRLKLNLSGSIIVSVGRLVPWKGFGVLIDLMPEIIAAVPDARLLIIGDGPELENLKSKTKNEKLEDGVKFLGPLAQGALRDYLAAADVFVLNTGYEGFSHIILEALSLGLPVVTTSSGGNREIVNDGENGLIVGWNDKRELLRAIIRITRDSAFREILSSRAKESVKKYGVDNMIGGLIESFL